MRKPTIKQKAEILDKMILHAETIEQGLCVDMKVLTLKQKTEVYNQSSSFLSMVRSEFIKLQQNSGRRN